jgi:phenylacetate-CoA ligase
MNHMPGEIDLYIDACRRFRPAASGNMNHAMAWEIGRRAAEERLDVKDLFSSFRAINFGGDRIPNTLRRLVEGWGVPIFDTASSGDASGCSECRMHDGFHAWEDMVYVEVLEPGGRAPVAEGKMGELVVTSLVDFHAPFIRTRTDDLVTYSSKPCGCGMQFGRHWTLGRTGDVVPVAGQDILPRQVAELVENQPETVAALFQIVRHKAWAVEPTLELRVGYSKRLLRGEPAVAIKSLAERLEADLHSHFSVPVRVSLIEDVELHKIGPPHKIPRILKV